MSFRKTVGNVLSENYHDYGHGLATARAAFSEIESATHTQDVDVSLGAFLHPWKVMRTKVYASLLNGGQELSVSENGVTPTGFQDVDVLLPDGYKGDLDSMYVDGGDIVDSISLQDENTYIMSPNAFADLSTILKLGYSGNNNRGLLREYMFADRCALIEETHANIVYREKDGVKRIVSFPATERKFMTFSDIFDAMCKASEKTGEDFHVDTFDITQERKKVAFSRGENKPLVTITWTDSRYRAPQVFTGYKKATVGKDEKMKDVIAKIIKAA